MTFENEQLRQIIETATALTAANQEHAAALTQFARVKTDLEGVQSNVNCLAQTLEELIQPTPPQTR